MGREFELKYRATDEQIEAIRAQYGDFETICMETTYFDNADEDFSRMRWTLRRRLENGRSVCTLKTPLSDGSRGEWEVESDSIDEAVLELCKLGASRQLLLLTASGVAPSCGARFTRLAKTLDIGGCTLELALDRGVLLGGGKELPFAEVEVEYKGGDENVTLDFAKALAAQFHLTAEPRSKIARAQALAKPH